MPSPLLEVHNLRKRYPGVQALDDVSFTVGLGEVLGLAGENGAGKSTIFNCISGVTQPDTGKLFLNGAERSFRTYHEASLAGIFRVYQHQALVPNLRVFENLYLSHERRFRRFGFVSPRAMARAAADVLASVGHPDLDPWSRTSSHDYGTRQVIEITRALALTELLEVDHPVILLDEPTSALAQDEVHQLVQLVERLKQRAAFVFVSHRLQEVVELCDRLLVLKDGAGVAMVDDMEAVTEGDIHQMMVGRARAEDFFHESRRRVVQQGVPVLSVRQFSDDENFRGVTFELRAGEVLGIGGLVGSGKSSLGRALFDRPRASAVTGTVALDGQTRPVARPRVSIDAGVGYVPTERSLDGVIALASVATNIGLAKLATEDAPLVRVTAERDEARRLIADLGIKTPSHRTAVGNLSGGNQQKVVLARWLAASSRIFLLDNPTNGVDVGAKQEIYGLIRDLTDGGAAVLLITDDLPELIGMSNRILIMRDGQVSTEVASGDDPTEAELVAAMV